MEAFCNSAPVVAAKPTSTSLTRPHFLCRRPNGVLAQNPLRIVPQACASPEAPKEELDLVERVFNFFMGPKEQEPFGLKRFDRDRFPELYVATLDEFADPVESDDAEMAMLRPMLARTQLQERELQLVFDAEEDGWDADAFHRAVNRRGASYVYFPVL